jgi:glycerol-3-phosphate acyltransferase PlsY
MISVKLAIIAVAAYFLGCFQPGSLLCRKYLGGDIKSCGRTQRGYEAFVRNYGTWGCILQFVPDVLKIILTVLMGGWILNDPAEVVEVGRGMAFFGLLMGTIFPCTRRFVGGRGIIEFLLGLIIVNSSAGIMSLFFFLVVTYFTKYTTWGIVAALLAGFLGIVIFGDNPASVILIAFCGIIVLFRHINHIIRIFNHKEQKLSKERDISYKFDEDFKY